MKEEIQHLRTWILPGDIKAVTNALSEGAICNWRYAEKLSASIKEYSGFQTCLLYSTGTLALRAALLSLNLSEGSTVGIPSFTCKEVLTGVITAGYKPYILDCDDAGLMDAKEAYRAFKRQNIHAAVSVHQFGLINRGMECLTSEMPVIEDCCHVPPKQYLKRSQAIFGSLEGTKLLGAGEGGYLLLNDSMNIDNINKTNIGLGNRLSDLIAVLSLCQLNRLSENIRRREYIASEYKKAVRNNHVIDGERASWFRFLVHMESPKLVDDLIENGQKAGIILKRPIMPFPLHKYIDEFEDKCTNTEKLWTTLVSIPLYPNLKDSEIRYIMQFLRNNSLLS